MSYYEEAGEELDRAAGEDYGSASENYFLALAQVDATLAVVDALRELTAAVQLLAQVGVR